MSQKRISFPTLPAPLALARFAVAEDLRAAIGLWVGWLAGERRASAHTIAAYGRDLAFFFDFLTQHRGELPSLATINELRPADFRAYLAHRAQDRIERSSLARAMSVLRGFVRFVQRRGLASTTALAALRAPKLPQGIPKPLTIEDAIGSLDAVGDLASKDWQGKRDTAILALLYGCGLRLSEALGLSRAEAPLGEIVVITGKGGKQRLLPVVPAVICARSRSFSVTPACRRHSAIPRSRPSASLLFTRPRTPAPMPVGQIKKVGEEMALKRLVLQIGMGTDIRGADYTKAAVRAVRDALWHNSLSVADAVGLPVDAMQVDVTIGVPRPDHVDKEAVLAVLPHGTGTVRVVEGGLEIPNDAGTNTTVIANAAAIVRLDIAEGSEPWHQSV